MWKSLSGCNTHQFKWQFMPHILLTNVDMDKNMYVWTYVNVQNNKKFSLHIFQYVCAYTGINSSSMFFNTLSTCAKTGHNAQLTFTHCKHIVKYPYFNMYKNACPNWALGCATNANQISSTYFWHKWLKNMFLRL